MEYPALSDIYALLLEAEALEHEEALPTLLQKLLYHSKAARYGTVLLALLERRPALFTEPDAQGYLVGEQLRRRRNYEALAQLINLTRPGIAQQQVARPLLRSYRGEERLIVRAAQHYDVYPLPSELQQQRLDHLRHLSPTLLERIAFRGELDFFLVVWQSARSQGLLAQLPLEEIWQEALTARCAPILELLYQAAPQRLDTYCGGYRLHKKGIHLLLNVHQEQAQTLSQLYHLTEWPLSISEALRGVMLHKADARGNTLLHRLVMLPAYRYEEAAQAGLLSEAVEAKEKAIGWLLQHRFEVDFTARHDRRSALHLACNSQQARIAALLIAHGADPTLADHNGVRARSLLKAQQQPPAAEVKEAAEAAEQAAAQQPDPVGEAASCTEVTPATLRP